MQKFVTVPPGYKVVVVSAQPQSSFVHLESGAYVAVIGNTNEERAIAPVSKLGMTDNLFWVIDESAATNWIAHPTVASLWLHKFYDLKGRIHCNFVVAGTSHASKVMRELIASLDLPVFSTAPDNAAIAEVHKPDGTITLGMCGPPLPRLESRILEETYTKMKQTSDQKKLDELKRNEAAFIERVIKNK